jgi:hypothetical protein
MSYRAICPKCGRVVSSEFMHVCRPTEPPAPSLEDDVRALLAAVDRYHTDDDMYLPMEEWDAREADLKAAAARLRARLGTGGGS